MKRSILSMAAALLLIASACTEEKDIDLVVALSNDYEFDVTGNGTFEVSDEVSTQDLQDISFDIDDELKAGLKRVSIEAIEVELVSNPGNTASSVNGSLSMEFGTETVLIFPNATINVDAGITTIEDLAPGAIAALKIRLEEVIDGTNFDPIAGEVEGSVNDGELDAKLKISIKASVVGTQSVELPDL